MGHRDASGWHVDEQGPVKGGLKADKYYNMLLSVNGLNATLVIDNKMAFTHTYAPRVVDGYSYGLNWGLVGVGSNNSQGAFDNISVQVLPPQVTFDETENFASLTASDPIAFDVENGTWSVSGGRYGVTPNGTTGISLLDIGPDNLAVSSYLELNAKVSTAGRAGFVFDRYADGTFKFVALDAVANEVIIGHYTQKGGWVSDATVAKTIGSGNNTLGVTLKGTTVSVTLNGQTVLGFAFNATTVDGRFGLLATGSAASFDDLRVRTDDPAFADSGGGSMIAGTAVDADSGATLTQSELDAIATVVISQWTEALGEGDARLAAFADVHLVIGDLAGGDLGHTEGNTVVVDGDGAGVGWYVDVSPTENSEFRVRLDRNVFAAAPESDAYGRYDLVTVVAHELGHLLGFDHDDAGQRAVMNEALDPGVRYVLDAGNAAGVTQPVAPQPQASTQASQPTSNAKSFEFDALFGATAGSNVGVEWPLPGASDWGVQLSPYAPPSAPKFSSTNLAEFSFAFGDDADDGQSEGFDSMGRDLLGGNGKAKR